MLHAICANRLVGGVLTFVAVLSLATPAQAEPVLIDDFDDGDDVGWTHIDVLDLMGFGPTSYDASSGQYAMTSATTLPPLDFVAGAGAFWTESAVDPQYSEGFLRHRFSPDNPATNTFTAMRLDPVTGNFYNFAVENVGNTLYILLAEGFTGGTILAEAPFEIVEGQEYFLEAGAVGADLSLKVWAVGDPEPPLPQLTTVDSTYSVGALALGMYNQSGGGEGGQLSARFDDVTFVPEPTSLVMLMLAGLMLTRRRIR